MPSNIALQLQSEILALVLHGERAGRDCVLMQIQSVQTEDNICGTNMSNSQNRGQPGTTGDKTLSPHRGENHPIASLYL